jgi:dihydroneopterin aldolase
MKLKGKVVLEGLEFHAYHGIYPEERSSGNKFEVDIAVDTTFDESAFHDDLSGTINYEEIYAIVKGEMETPSKLLEPVAHSIAQKILDSFSSAINTEVTISKFNPPIGGVCRKAQVSVELKRNGNS